MIESWSISDWRVRTSIDTMLKFTRALMKLSIIFSEFAIPV